MAETQPHDTAIDLTNCDHEPIHILGHVQSFGCLIAFSLDWNVTHASVNCQGVFGQDAKDLIGGQVTDIISKQAVHDLRTRLQILKSLDAPVRLFSYALFEDDRTFDLALHMSGRDIVLEIEPRTGPDMKLPDQADVQALISRLQDKDGITKMAHEAARGLKVLSGFDRVMVYRLEEDDSGTVIAEAHAPTLKPFLGLRYPASDIPKQARALYVRTPLRLISDVDDPTHSIVPDRNPLGEPLDLSQSTTRAVSPIHLEYLRNMGVAASMSVSILRKGKLWGLLACHHRTPRHVTYEERSLIELFAQLFNYELAQKEMEQEFSDLDRSRTLQDKLMSLLSDGQTIFDVFDVFEKEIKEVIPFDGASVYSDGSYKAVGSAPTEDEFLGLVRFLNTTPTSTVYAIDNLGRRFPDAANFASRVAGMLVLPITRIPRDYFVLFRREVAKSVSWAGNPEKPVEPGPNGARLTPRKSFEAWQEVVRGQSAPWRLQELRTAEALRVTLLEIVLKMSDESNAARKRAQDHQELLIAELNHRVRNILTLIQGLVSQSKNDTTSVEDYEDVLDARILALARAHDQLTDSEWEWVSFKALVETGLYPFVVSQVDSINFSGDPIALSPTAFTTMALVVHELVTNAVKYGAFSNINGSVNVTVTLDSDGTAKILWQEVNGPSVPAPRRRGFGTTIIERSVPFELSGLAEMRFRAGGLEAEFSLPAEHVQLTDTVSVNTAPPALANNKQASLTGHVLVVEDNMLIALDASDMVSKLGAESVSTASSTAVALQVVDQVEVSFALIDVHLGNETSYAIIESCLADRIPLVIATGYGATKEITDRFPNTPIIKKPYTLENLKAALSQVKVSV